MTVTDEELIAYREGRLDPISDAALEELLMVDVRLRRRLATLVEPERIDNVWSEVNRTIDQPRPGRLERLAGRLGVPEPAARLAGATPTLNRSWAGGIAALALVSLILSADPNGARGDDRFLGYLILSPLILVAAVAAAYGRSTDPAHELTIAAPLSGTRLMLWRVVAVAPTAALVNIAVGLLLRTEFVFAWILPGLACTSSMLALSTRFSVRRAAAIVTAVYLVLVGTISIAATDSIAAYRVPGQVTALLLTVVAVVALRVRRDDLEGSVRW